MPMFTIIDRDGTTLGFTRDAGARCVEGFVPASGNRLLHPVFAQNELDEAAREARSAEFWQSVATMPAPVGISSDGSF